MHRAPASSGFPLVPRLSFYYPLQQTEVSSPHIHIGLCRCPVSQRYLELVIFVSFLFYSAQKVVLLKHTVQNDFFWSRLNNFKNKLVFVILELQIFSWALLPFFFFFSLMGISCLRNLPWLLSIMLLLPRDQSLGEEKGQVYRQPCRGGGREK